MTECQFISVHLQDVFTLLKSFYRVILFAPPTDSLPLLEQIYITSRRILDLYKSVHFFCLFSIKCR